MGILEGHPLVHPAVIGRTEGGVGGRNGDVGLDEGVV